MGSLTRLALAALRTSVSSAALVLALAGCSSQPTDCCSAGVAIGNPSVSPTMLNFGSVPAGQTVLRPLMLEDVGNRALTVTAQTVSVSDAGATFAVATPFAATVAVGVTSTAMLSFAPTAVGAFTATLTLDTNGDPATVSVTLTGVGLDAPDGG